MSAKKAHDILNDPDFRKLSSSKDGISMTLVVLELIVYFGFIALVAFNKEFLSTKITSNMTIGIPLGIGVILVSWVFTGVYVRWANNTYDRLVEQVKSKMGG